MYETRGRNPRASSTLLAAMLATGCFEDPIDQGVDDTTTGSTATSTGETELTATGPSSDTDPTVGSTTGSTTQASADDTETQGSTGDPLPLLCGDGLVAPGELCFEETTVVMANDATHSARIGDVSGTSSGDLVHLIPDQVVIRVGDGNGDFGPAVFDASVVSEHIELADFDDDGELDLVVAETAGSLQLLRGSGAGSFASSDTVAVDLDPRALTVGDLDGDGNLDAVVGTNAGNLHAVLGDGAGGLMALPAVTSFGATRGLSLGDVDGDGALDLAIAVDGGGWQGVALRRGLGNGMFADQEPTPAQLPGARAVATGDFDGDGATDVAYVSAANDALGVLLGDGAGLPREVTIATGSTPSTLLAADLDNDGHEDLVVGHEGDTTLRIFVVEPGGAVTEGLQLTLATPITGLGAGDVNDDGVLDLAATSTSADIVTLVLSTP